MTISRLLLILLIATFSATAQSEKFQVLTKKDPSMDFPHKHLFILGNIGKFLIIGIPLAFLIGYELNAVFALLVFQGLYGAGMMILFFTGINLALYAIYKLTCPWGKHLLHEGTLYLPNPEGKWVPISDPSIDKKVADDVSYNITMPLGMVLKNSVELYINTLGRISPWMLMPEGKIFGLWIRLFG